MDLSKVIEDKYRSGVLSKSLIDSLEGVDDIDESYFDFPPQRVRSERKWNRVLGGNPLGGCPKPDSTNPPITNRGGTFHEVDSDFECPHIMGGYDGGIEIGFDGIWSHLEFSELLTIFEEAKQASQAGDGLFEIDGQIFKMSPTSAGGGVTYNYVFQGNGVKFYVHKSPSRQFQPIRIRYMAEGLIGVDFFDKHRETLVFLSKLGFSVECEKISRVDMQVMVKTPVREFINAILSQKYVCTAQNFRLYGKGQSNIQTFSLGTDLEICIYDKREELLSGGEPTKLYLMVKYCLGREWLENNEPCTRIEFRVRRDVLKDFDINDTDDLLEKEAAFVDYLTSRWFRILKENRKRGHTHEQETSELWKKVCSEFKRWYPGRDGHNVKVERKYRRIAGDNDALLLQAAGCIASFVGKNLNIDEIENCDQMVSDIMSDLRDRIRNRAMEHSKNLQVESRVVTSGEIKLDFPKVEEWRP
jgi:hypothetical protein